MDDDKIISLYGERDERAIGETKSKYGKYCYTVAYNILHCHEDTEECENDTYQSLWNCIPPHRPLAFSAFLGNITRSLSLKKLRDKNAKKRGDGTSPLSLTELSQCIPDSYDFEDTVNEHLLAGILSDFLRTLPDTERRIFIRRYWHCDSIADIQKRFGFGKSKIKMMLLRTRERLREHLRKEGVFHEKQS